MSRVTVCKVSNIVLDDGGFPLLDEEGNFIFKDDEDYGFLVKSHVLTHQILDPETGKAQLGFVSRHEVYWNKQRTPVCTLESADDLFWLEFEEDSGSVEADGETEEETDDEEEYDDASDSQYI